MPPDHLGQPALTRQCRDQQGQPDRKAHKATPERPELELRGHKARLVLLARKGQPEPELQAPRVRPEILGLLEAPALPVLQVRPEQQAAAWPCSR